MRNRYNLMQRSTVKASDGSTYPDVLSLPIKKFRFTEPPIEYVLQERDLDRPDLLMQRAYSVTEFDDLVFWLNGFAYLGDIPVGTTIYIPSRVDLEDFFLENRV